MDQHATKPNFAFIEFASSSSCDAALQKGLTFLGGRLLNVSKRKQRDREVNDRPSDAQAKILRQVATRMKLACPFDYSWAGPLLFVGPESGNGHISGIKASRKQ